jgi:hypothetical protein
VRKLGFVASLFGLLVFAAGALSLGTSTADAHERRSVGAYNFVVGWLGEPAYLNTPNDIDLRVSRASDGTPVTGLEQTVKVQVSAEGKTMDATLKPRSGTPGAYNGRVIPTAKGAYAFKFTGTIEGQQINETFTASPTTFGLIEEPQGFPNSVPTNQSLEESLGGVEQRLVKLETADNGSDSTALLIGIAGVILGLVGIGTGAMALSKKS